MIFKQSFGIDIAKESFTVVLAYFENNKIYYSKPYVFKNSDEGFNQFLNWAIKKAEIYSAAFIMEATGIYYEKLAFFLHSHKLNLFVINPTNVKSFFKFNGISSKTDSIDAKYLSQIPIIFPFLKPWNPQKTIIKILKELIRTRHKLTKIKTEIKNLKHANDFTYIKIEQIENAYDKLIKEIELQIKKLDALILKTIKQDEELFQKFKFLTTIKGVAFITAITMIAETNAFENFSNPRKLISYAGLDIALKQSGKISRKPRISKKGNKYIRYVLYNAALSFKKYSKTGRFLFNRLTKKLNKPPKVAIIALERKLIKIMFAIWKYNIPYDDDYYFKKHLNQMPEELLITD